MGIDHCGSHIVVAEKLLYRSNVITTFQQMSDKRMPEGMTRRPLSQESFPLGLFLRINKSIS